MNAPGVCFGAVNLDLLYREEELAPFLETVPGMAAITACAPACRENGSISERIAWAVCHRSPGRFPAWERLLMGAAAS